MGAGATRVSLALKRRDVDLAIKLRGESRPNHHHDTPRGAATKPTTQG